MKGLDLAKVARGMGRRSNVQPGCTKPRKCRKDHFRKFRREVERELIGEDKEQWKIVYFKLYKSQIPVIDRGG